MSRLFVEGATLLGLTDRRDIRRETDLYAEDGTVRAAGPEARGLAERPGEPVLDVGFGCGDGVDHRVLLIASRDRLA